MGNPLRERRDLGDPKRIASESTTVEEYARRAEAWNASEAKPMSLTLLAKFWAGGRQSSKVMKALREAREERLEQREQLWSRMSKGLKGRATSGGRLGGMASKRARKCVSDEIAKHCRKKRGKKTCKRPEVLAQVQAMSYNICRRKGFRSIPKKRR